MKADNTIYLIGRIREKANNLIISELKQLGMREVVPSHGDILVTLFKYKELTMTKIANQIHRDRSTVTTLVNKLMKLGYVETKKNPEDSRSSLVYLTQKGKELESDFIRISNMIFEIEYKDINEEEKQVFRNVLKKIYDNLP
ncbi:MarR family transcriptional regulator [Clostridium aestuarii]|uniref:MarR family transcriptional regulator n=1 Tax=Clostridium aestuarii TaxID=338193 RepID=A0ABT4CY52_9CLOT|nr:MarR family transcriptional regulator [Clostridium aestuarii]MCY6483035.1 MarR family transcriptional regulator [Clostridium aestuarii]